MKIKEIRVSKSGVIPIASYSNLKPGYEIVADVDEKDDIPQILAKLQDIIDERFNLEENKALTKLIKKQFKNVGFHKNEKDGKEYPRESSIMDWDKEWRIPKYELKQYGARGTIVHKISHLFLLENKWYDPNGMEDLQDEVNLLLSGNLKLHWKDCSHKKFFEKYRKDIGKIEAMEEIVFNEELFYSATPDLIAPFQGLKSVIDYKTGIYNFAQLASFAACLKGIKQLVIFPVGKCDNVSGYKKPIIKTDWKVDWDSFVEKRRKFRENFGI